MTGYLPDDHWYIVIYDCKNIFRFNFFKDETQRMILIGPRLREVSFTSNVKSCFMINLDCAHLRYTDSFFCLEVALVMIESVTYENRCLVRFRLEMVMTRD